MADLNRLIKMQRQMADTMKRLGKKGGMKGALGALMGGGQPPALGGMGQGGMDAKALEAATRQMGTAGGLAPGLGDGRLPPSLSGFGKKT